MAETTEFTLNTFKNAHWLVYINGLEVPVMSVNTSFEVWKFPMATIEMVPHPYLQRLGNEDRIQVVVFFLDIFKDPDDPTFRILGEYEVVGWAYTNSGFGRTLQLNCVSQLQIFAQLFFFYMSNVDDVIVGGGAAFATAAHAGSGAKVFFPSSLFISGLVPQGAKSDGDEPKKTEGSPATNTSTGGNGPEYGTAAERKEPAPGQEILDETEFIRTPIEFITNIFKALVAFIDPIYGNPDVTENPNRMPINAVSIMGRNFFGRWMLTTRFHRRWVALPIFEDDDARSEPGCFPVVKAIQGYHLLRIMQKNVMSGVGQAQPIWELLQMVYGNMYMDVVPIPAPAAVRQDKKTWIIERELKKGDLPIPKPSKGNSEDLGVSYKTSQTHEVALTSYIVKPQSVFGIPPRCNIIFPSMIENFSFQEDYMNQPTRLYMGETLVTDLLTQADGQSTGFSSLVAQQLTTGYPPVVRARMEAYVTDPSKNTKNFILYAEEFFRGPNTARLNAPPWLFLLAQAAKTGGGIPGRIRGLQKKINELEGQYAPPDSEGWKRFLKAKELIDTLCSAPTVKILNPPGNVIPPIPPGAIYGRTWSESKFLPSAHTAGGASGLSQIFAVGANGAGVIPAANLPRPYFAWNAEFHKLIEYVRKNAAPGDEYVDDMLDYYDANLVGVDIFKKSSSKKWRGREPVRAFWKQPGFNLVLGHLETQKFINITFIHYGYKSINWNDAYVAFSAVGPKGLRDAKKALPVKNKAGWIPSTLKGGNALTYAAGSKAAWAHFCGGKYGEGTFPTYEDDVDASELGTDENVLAVTQTVTLDALGSTFDLFAKYEFYRQKYAQRNMSLSLVFNPYIVPGFPCAVIDEPSAPINFLGYVTGVSHTMSATPDGPQMRTNVSVSFVRTLGEYLVIGLEEESEVGEALAEQALSEDGTTENLPTGQSGPDIIAQGNPVLTKAQLDRYISVAEELNKFVGHPYEPIVGVRKVFQHLDDAEELYARLFYPGDNSAPKTKARKRHLFHQPDYFRAVDDPSQAEYLAKDFLLQTPIFEMTSNFIEEARSYDKAMAFVARPACSLKNYVLMWHRRDDASKIAKSQGVIEKASHPAAQAVRGKNTYYYPRIYTLRPGPVPAAFGTAPKSNPTIINGKQVEFTEATGRSAKFRQYIKEITNVDLKTGEGVDPMKLLGTANRDSKCLHPQTRFDWDRILEQYVTFIKNSTILTGKESK